MKRQIYKIKDVSSTNYSALGVEDVKLFVDETNDITGGGVTEFIELTDVPASYTGQASKVVAVKADETGLEFVAGGGGGTTPTLEEVLTEGNNTTKDIEFQEDTVTYIPRRLFSNNTEYGDTTFEVFMNDPDSNALYGLSHKDNTTGALSYVRLRKDLITMLVSDNLGQDSGFTINLNNIELRGNMGDKGLVGFIDFSANYDNLTYVQKIYVDNAIAGVTTPDATASVKGIAKLYTSLGSNTDGAVDQNTVNSALALKANLQNVEQIIRSKSNGTFGSHTGDTAETVIAVIDIDANEFEAGDWMTLLFSGEKNANAGNITWKLRVGVNGNTSDNQIAILTAPSGNSRYSALYRARPQFLTGNQLRIWGSTGSVSTDISVSGAPTLAFLTPTSAWKLTVTAQLSVSTETASLTGYRIGKIKSF